MKKAPVQRPKGLMAKLAKSLKIDLWWLQRAGLISPGAVRRMQNHCGACSDPEICSRQIDHADGKMVEPPEFCPNRNMFLALMKDARKRRYLRAAMRRASLRKARRARR